MASRAPTRRPWPRGSSAWRPAFPSPPNENNDILRRGCEALGYSHAAIRRNVKGCWNLGYCGMGCPTNAKQSMLVTTIPSALEAGATLVQRGRLERLVHGNGRVSEAVVRGVAGPGAPMGHARLTVRARHFVLAAGSIGTPAILLRSAVPDPSGLTGRRTFLHPTVVSAAVMPGPVEGYSGAPQTIYSDHFLDTLPVDGPMGYKLEAPPIHPILAGITLPGYGADHGRWMREFPKLQVLIALLRDGFHPDSPGGTVRLRSDGSPELDYPLGAYLWDGVRRAYLTMAELQFAAGAKTVMALHEDAGPATTWAAAREAIGRLPMAALHARVVSAHVMGGCPMGSDAARALVREDGRHHHVENLSVHDGSVFPTSIGANPQLSIYATAARMAEGLAAALGARPATPARAAP
ncbi:MAG TPA: GMC family oxidoreductase [Usitatibacteraceae bacterium]|nr:GMC family oxidoreductase [Usitatibacteraceae bacterium]